MPRARRGGEEDESLSVVAKDGGLMLSLLRCRMTRCKYIAATWADFCLSSFKAGEYE